MGRFAAAGKRLGVPANAEFKRICELPRRPRPSLDSAEAEELADWLTDALAKPEHEPTIRGGRGGRPLYPGRLRPAQALFLREIWQQKQEGRGAYGSLPVGTGKMAVAALAPEVLQAERAVLLTTAGMSHETMLELDKMRKTYKMRPAHEYPILTYTQLGHPNGGEAVDKKGRVIRASLLERYRPTVIICDELDSLKDMSSVAAGRMAAYCRKYPDTIVIGMTGTPAERYVQELCHILGWCLGEGSPLPRDVHTQILWGQCLDASVQNRIKPGALLHFVAPDDRAAVVGSEWRDDEYGVPSAEVDIVRRAVGLRVWETPGTISVAAQSVDVPLHVKAWVVDGPKDQPIEDLAILLHGDPKDPDDKGYMLPDGRVIPDALQRAAHDVCMGFGFWRHWQPDPGDEYRFFAKHWAKWVRDVVKVKPHGIDSEARAKGGVLMGLLDDKFDVEEDSLPMAQRHLDGKSRLEKWEEARAAYTKKTGHTDPPSVAVWVSDEVVGQVRRWVELHKGVVWVDHGPLGEKLSEALGIPYYRNKGKTKDGRFILNHPPGTPAIASVKANGRGRNLQKIWHKNLWLVPPGEQNLGRTHRAGQTKAVENWIYVGCVAHLRAFYAARDKRNRFAEAFTLSQRKLRQAEADMPTEIELAQKGGVRWDRR